MSKEEFLKLKLTEEFLNVLVEAARVVGHSVDYVEVESFVREVYNIAGKQCPNLDPYEEEDVE